MNRELRDRLIEAARAQTVIGYSDLEQMLALDMDNPNDRRRVGEYLGEISRFEVAGGRPMLSSVVWHKDMSGPGRGFFNLAVELGIAGSAEDEMAFAVRELKRTYEYWSSEHEADRESSHQEGGVEDPGPVEPVTKLAGRAVEDAAIEWVIEYERRAGREAMDRRYVREFVGDLESTSASGERRIIELKASGTSYRGWFLPFEPSQFHAAGVDPTFFVYVVENVAQGNPAAFTLRILDPEHLARLKERFSERHYFEMSWPTKDYDATQVETRG